MTDHREPGPQPFLVVGAMKSGTTTLSSLLADHPEVDLISEKESSSFLDRSTASTAASKLRSSRATAAGEVSTAYTQAPVIDCDPGIARDFVGDDLKIVAVLREPYSRALSHWRHWAQLDRNPDGELDDLLARPDQPYVQFSRYYSQLEPWIATFGASQVLALKLEDYERSATNWTVPLGNFLGVSPEGFDTTSIRRENSGDGRVVSRGVGSRIKQLQIYQKLRPLIPTAARKRAALALGGTQGGHQTVPTGDTTKAAFLRAISTDMAELARIWPNLTWEKSGEKST